MSLQISYKKQTLFGIVLLFCIFSVVESGSRIYEFFLAECRLENAETLKEYDYFLKKQICYDHQLLEYHNAPVYSIKPNQHYSTININNHGFRGSDFDISNPNNEYRIVIIGGSTVFGAGMANDEQTFPHELNNILDKHYENVRVINAGISSITSFEELYHIKEKIIPFNPNMIIVYDGANDVYYKKTNEQEILNVEDEKFGLNDLQSYLRSPVVLYRYFLFPLFNSELGVSENLYKDISIDYKSENFSDEQISNIVGSLWYERIQDFCKISKNNDIPSIVIIQPTLDHGIKPLSNFEDSIYKKIPYVENTFEILEQKSKILDECTLVSNFDNVFEDTNEGVYFDRVHLNNFGNKIIANQIFEKISPLLQNDLSK